MQPSLCEVGFAVRRRRVQHLDHMVAGPDDCAVTFSTRKSDDWNSVDVNGQAIVITVVGDPENRQPTVAHQFGARVLITSPGVNCCRDCESYRGKKHDDQFACGARILHKSLLQTERRGTQLLKKAHATKTFLRN